MNDAGAMAERFHHASPMASLTFERSYAEGVFLAALRSTTAQILVLDIDGPKGLLVAEVCRYLGGPDLLAKEVLFWIEPEARGKWAKQMMAEMENWAVSRGARFFGMTCFADGRTHRLYERAGFSPTEMTMMKELPWRSSRASLLD